MRALVIGAGAVGLGLGSCLLAGAAQVAFLARRETARALRERGLRRSGLFGESAHAPQSFEVAEDLPTCAGFVADWVLVAVKSFDSAALARALAAEAWLRDGGAQLVLCQNGWGNAEVFAAELPQGRIWNARVITGFRRIESNRVDITVHAEAIRVGSLFGRRAEDAAPLCAAIARGGIPCETSSGIAQDLWAKLLYNALLNPLGAICGVPYGALGESAETRALMATLAEETFAVMRAAGFATHWPSAAAYLETFYAKLLPPTASHESSMLQDLRAGCRTEIDALTGAVVRLGEAHGVATPASRALLEIVRFLESR